MSTSPNDKLIVQWDAVPAERQEYYRRIYQREIRAAGASTDDAAELEVLRRLIAAYRNQALVPVGSRWVSVPQRVRDAARRSQPLTPDDEIVQSSNNRSSRLIGLLLLPLAGVLLYFLFSQFGGQDESDTLAASVTTTVTPTPTPEVSPTPTPLALEESDQVIRAGDGERKRTYYPVLLQIYPADGTPSRVFVVQERAIETADWRFDSNPDVASWVSGLLVRPVIGLPFSAENAALVRALGAGSRFDLQMNTGATLRFVYRESRQVTRQESAVFAQNAPGLTLVLIGETDEDGLLTETRHVIEAVYPVEQEIERLRAGELAAVVPMGQSAALAGLNQAMLTVQDTALLTPVGLPADLAYALVDVTLASQSEPLLTTGLNWVLEDAAGSRFNRDSNAESQGAFGSLPATIPAGSALSGSVGFLAPRTLTEARLLVTASDGSMTAFNLIFDPPAAPPTLSGLDVQIRQISYDAGAVYVDARIFNPQPAAVSLTNAVHSLVLGYVPSPLGPQLAPIGGALPANIAPETAFDLALTFPYSGEPYGRLLLLEREYALNITERR